jgi:membrane-associated protein
MSAIHWLLHILRDPGDLIAYGYPVIALIIFIESAIFPFLPGDSLLVVAGIYAAKGDINLLLLTLILIPAAVLGNAVAYFLGKSMGDRLFSRPDSFFFKPAYAQKAHDFYARYGGSAVVIARFVPIVRTFVPVIAGIGKMPYARFVGFNIVGGVLWILSMGLAGYFLGGFASAHGVPLEKHIEKVIVVVVFLSILPAIISYLRERRRAPAAVEKLPGGQVR